MQYQMRNDFSRRTFLGSLTAFSLSALVRNHAVGAPPDIEVMPWLAAHPTIAQAIVWENSTRGVSAPVAFPEWTRSQKEALSDAFRLAWQGNLDPQVDPAPNIIQVLDGEFAYTALAPQNAWRLYLSYIANSLVLEVGNRVSWSLAGYSPESLRIILDSREMFQWSSTYRGYEIVRERSGWAVPATPKTALGFLTNNRVARASSTAEAIANLLEWCRRNLYHYMGGPGGKNMEDHWQYRGYPPVSRVIAGTTLTSDPSSGNVHWTGGCHGTVGFLRANLRAINIPVKAVDVTEHALPFFPTESRYLSHADDLYNALSQIHPPKPNPPFPASKLLIDQTKFDSWFGSGIPEDTKKKNLGRRVKELALETLPVLVLKQHCKDLAAKRSHADSAVYGTFKQNYSVAQLEAANLWTRLNAELARLGGCIEF
jgi:hypothetical protein